MLKLGKLPDRILTKITITLAPELNRALRDYAALYRDTYGETELVADLIPFMLQAFLKTDKSFGKARKAGLPEANKEKVSRRSSRKPRGAEHVSPSQTSET